MRLRLRGFLFDLATSAPGSRVGVAVAGLASRLFDALRRPDQALQWAMLAHRLSLRLQPTGHPTAAQTRLERRFHAALRSGTFSRLAMPPSWINRAEELDYRALVLKAPCPAADGSPSERGVLLVTFTHLFGEMVRLLDIPRLTRDYTLVLEPSWSGYAHAEILQFAESSSSPVFVEATEERDFAFLERFHPALVPLPFGASNWVDPEVFTPPADPDRPWDAGYIGFWGAVKRHHALFRALRRMREPGFRIALIGGAWQGNKEEVAALARWYGVESQVAFFERLTATEVAAVIGRCRVSVLLSRKEGSNRGLFESMFAGTPALLLEENLGVRKAYVNEHTGRVVREADLVEALRWFRTHWEEFSPRAWALDHLSPVATTRALNRALRERAGADGEPWTGDCVVKTNRPEVMYLDPTDRDRLPGILQVLDTYRRR